jgi:hypothetical protein
VWIAIGSPYNGAMNAPPTQVAQETLWAGPSFKLESALFHYTKMVQACTPPELDAHTAAMLAAGAIVDTGWQRYLYPHFDAFLVALRSVPEIIQCCFGKDVQNKKMKQWWDGLPPDEQARRIAFSSQYDSAYQAFRTLPLSECRHVSQHRTGLPDVEVSIRGSWGVMYVGGPAKAVPISETPELPLPFMAKPRALQPHHGDFSIRGQPLFPECLNYLNSTSALVTAARAIAAGVHGAQPLTVPPA